VLVSAPLSFGVVLACESELMLAESPPPSTGPEPFELLQATSTVTTVVDHTTRTTRIIVH
jgi:hypothetical protein